MKYESRLIQRLRIGLIGTCLFSLCGCGPSFRELRMEGIHQMLGQRYAPARYLLLRADELKRNEVHNLHDLGFCSIMIAKEYLLQGDRAGTLSELDRAIEYYDRAIDAHPGYQPSLVGKNIALELRGEPKAALNHARWAAKVVGPSARQYLFLADELDQRGDADAALLRYRQAVKIEPGDANAHILFAKFLLKHNNERAAVGHLQYAYKLDPKNPWVRGQLAARGKLPPPLPPKRPSP